MLKIRAGPMPASMFALVLVVAVAALWCTGCASDQALRDKSLEYTNVNEDTIEKDARPDLAAETKAEIKAKFKEHRNVALGKVDNKTSGEELRQAVLAIVDDQEAMWNATRRPDLPEGFLKITRNEFKSQRTVLRGK